MPPWVSGLGSLWRKEEKTALLGNDSSQLRERNSSWKGSFLSVSATGARGASPPGRHRDCRTSQSWATPVVPHSSSFTCHLANPSCVLDQEKRCSFHVQCNGFTLKDCSPGELGPFAFWTTWHSLGAWGHEKAGAITQRYLQHLCIKRNVHPDLLKLPRSELQKQLCWFALLTRG